MRAVLIPRPGGPEVLELRELPEPVPGPDEVLVRVRASALNRADLLQRRGRYPAPPGSPADVPGLEFAGEVERCGDRVAVLRPGDRVMGIVGGGAHAEKLRIHERECVRVPPALAWTDAAAVPEAFSTAWDALFVRAGLLAGEAVLVHAAGSGVGTAAVQLAAAAGARVAGTSRDAGKLRRLAALGVEHALPGDADDLVERVRLALGGHVDVVLDLLGAGALALDLEVLAPRGRLVLIGTITGSRAEIDLGRVMAKRLTVVGTVLRSRSVEEKIALARDLERTVVPLLAAGRVRPVVDRVLPLDRIAEAHALMERNENFGKIVLTV